MRSNVKDVWNELQLIMEEGGENNAGVVRV